MKPAKFILIFFTYAIIFLFSSNIVRGDIIPPPDVFWTPFALGVFAGNLILNFIFFGIAYLIFVERNIRNINKKSFLITIFLITIVGFFADSVALQYYRTQQMIVAFIVAVFIMFVLDFLIYRFYLKLETKKSMILAIWMAVFTNPFLYMIITVLLSVLLPRAPYTPHFPQ